MGSYYESPFGTALTGDYTIKFSVSTLENLNLYIKIEKGPKSLHDKIPMEEHENIILYHVTRFSNGMNQPHNITLKTDYMYKFYIGRVSPVSIVNSSHVDTIYILKDPEGIKFTIFMNETLTIINDVDTFKFGTAIAGTYQVNLIVHGQVQYTNIGYAIIEFRRISELVTPNVTVIPDPEPVNNTHFQKNVFSMPAEWSTGILVFFGSFLVVIGVIVVKNRKKNYEYHERINKFKGDPKDKE
ncbi:hypothetical protein LCGC14_1446260 [marine sediment metagenome]|uniref:Uncharacterized protein n=2 Tax=marine sediment metagenome TaxID=412755 RepID=A0A0F9K5G4_9ZZZZ|nr:hypothetical protein [bacterium]